MGSRLYICSSSSSSGCSIIHPHFPNLALARIEFCLMTNNSLSRKSKSRRNPDVKPDGVDDSIYYAHIRTSIILLSTCAISDDVVNMYDEYPLPTEIQP